MIVEESCGVDNSLESVEICRREAEEQKMGEDGGMLETYEVNSRLRVDGLPSFINRIHFATYSGHLQELIGCQSAFSLAYIA